MKLRISLFNFRIAFYMIAILILMIGTVNAQLVTNGGFERSAVDTVSGADVEGWLMFDGNAGAVFEIVDDTVKAGNKALKVTVNTAGGDQWNIQAFPDSIPVKQNGIYNYSVWAKAENPGAQVNFTVGYFSTGEISAIRPANLTTEWKEYKMQFTVTENQSYVRAPIHFSYASNVGNAIYIDSMSIIDPNMGKTPVIVEAESGMMGSELVVQDDGDITYVTASSNYEDLTSPGDTSRMISYQVTFEDSGYYNLFARLRVGENGPNDDSFFSGRGFGEKNDTTSTDWVMVNGLAYVGFNYPGNVVYDQGAAGTEIWKWINVTRNFYPNNSPKDSFYVSSDSLTKTFQIGSREDGLYIDKFAFGKSRLFFTVDDLDNELPGSITMPEVDSTKYYQGPSLAEGLPKFLGNVKSLGDNKFANYWNQLTPGNEGKWGSVATTMDTNSWNWYGLDTLYNYAKAYGLLFKNHCLIWGAQQPSWIDTLNTDQQLNYIETWIRMVGQRYPDMDMIDVVNEPLLTHNPPDGMNGRANYKAALGGNGATGWDWVIKSFELARKYIPNAKLILNDFGIINDNNATASYLTIINLLNERGLIDGIGVQGHRFELEEAATSTLTYNLDRLAATGLPIYISEMDLGNLSNYGTPSDTKQLQLYKKIFPVLWQHPGVKGITLWGYIEGQMWQSTCFLVRYDFAWRPALEWLAQYIIDNPVGIVEPKNTLEFLYSLEQNYPNPFNPTTTISYQLSVNSDIDLSVYNLLGQKVATLFKGKQKAGIHTVEFDGSNLASGVYFYRLDTKNMVKTKKLILLK